MQTLSQRLKICDKQAMGEKGTVPDNKQFKDMNLDNGVELDSCHQRKAIANDSTRKY